jgi:hypothetical protein
LNESSTRSNNVGVLRPDRTRSRPTVIRPAILTP